MLEVSWFVCSILCFFINAYLFCKVQNNKFRIDLKLILMALFLGILYYTLTKLNLAYYRPLIIHTYYYICFKIVYKDSYFKTLIGLLYAVILVSLAEIIFDFIMIFIFKINITLFNQVWWCFLLANLCIFVVSILLTKIRHLKKIFKNIVSWYNKNNFKSFLFLIILLILMLTFILYNNFVEILPSSLLLVTNLFCIGVLVFVLGYFKEKTNNNRITSEYERLLNYVKVYEQTIDEKSKKQHEYKNQLILISGMVKTKKVKDYINDLINEEQDDKNVELIRKIQYLPQGGLKGLIYYKVEEMINRGIDVYVDISPKLDDKKVKKVIKDNLHDISKIMGVYLDNAIEAVNEADKKYIVIDASVEKGNIIFSFSNTYKGCVNLSKLDKEGYTTKGNGKGYGLSLVKDIINKKKDIFSSERQVNGPYYVQKLYIKK